MDGFEGFSIVDRISLSLVSSPVLLIRFLIVRSKFGARDVVTSTVGMLHPYVIPQSY